MPLIRLATLNIGAASQQRAFRLLKGWLSDAVYDVLVLTECSRGPGTALIMSEFTSANWAVFSKTASYDDRGVLIASRISAIESMSYPADDPAPARSVVIELDTEPRLQVTGLYVPNRGTDPSKMDRKSRFLNSWMRHLRKVGESTEIASRAVLLGDFNVVPASQSPRFLPQQKFEYNWYSDLERIAGFLDAATTFSETGHEATWIAYTGEEYTYDHIFIQNDLKPHVAGFNYDHSPRLEYKVSDHSAVGLSLQLNAVDFMDSLRIRPAEQLDLFEGRSREDEHVNKYNC